jgi:hypothetical protein
LFAFVVYALAVWFLAAKWRRTFRGFAAVGCGLAGLILVAWFHLKLNDWTHGQIYVQVLQVLLYPYAGMVTAVGAYIAVLPRSVPACCCRACGYDLTGLAGEVELCPECGTTPPVPVRGTLCGCCGFDLGDRSRRPGVCPACGIMHDPPDAPTLSHLPMRRPPSPRRPRASRKFAIRAGHRRGQQQIR